MPQREIRGLSFTSAIKSGLQSVVEASCMEAILDFKIWGENALSWVLIPGHIYGRKVCAVRP